MNVIHTVGSIDLLAGGPSRSVTSLCSALATSALGVRPKLVTSVPQSGSRNVDCKGFLSVECPVNSGRSTYVSSILKLIDDESLLHDHGQWLPVNRASALVSRRATLPRIVTPRGMLSPWALNHHRWRKLAAWHAYAQRDLMTADLVHATSNLEMQELRELGVTAPIAVIPNGIDDDWFETSPLTHATRRRRRAVFLSRIHQKKGVDELIEAWRSVSPKGWMLTIAGNDDDGLLLDRTLPKSCRYIGFVDGQAKKDLLRSSDLFVLPSFSENFGIVIAEALASGLPVITTNQTPWSFLPEIGAGWVTDTGADALAEALQEATSLSRDELNVMGEQGRMHIQDGYGWQEIARQMSAVYAWIFLQTDAPDCVNF